MQINSSGNTLLIIILQINWLIPNLQCGTGQFKHDSYKYKAVTNTVHAASMTVAVRCTVYSVEQNNLNRTTIKQHPYWYNGTGSCPMAMYSV
jgi:hypothetical protein